MITSSIFENTTKRDLFNFLKSHYNEGMVVIKRDGEWTAECNDDLIGTLGFSGDTIQFPGFFNLMSSPVKDKLIACLENDLQEEKGALKHIIKLQSESGKLLTLRLNGYLIADLEGAPTNEFVFFIENLTDILEKDKFRHQCNLISKIGYWSINLEKGLPEWSQVTRLIHEVPDDFEPTMEGAIDFYKEGKSREAIKKAFDNTLKTGESYELDLILITYTKKEKWVRAIGQAELIDGKPVRVFGTFQDIHSKKIAQLNWTAEQEKFKYAVQGTNLGIWEWDIQTGETIFNDRWAEILGYKVSELEPLNFQTWVDLMDPEDLKVAETNLQACFEGKTDYYECEFKMRHKDGSRRWIHARGKVISYTDDGQPKIMFGTHQDINFSKIKVQKQAIFISQAPIAIAMFDKEIKYLAVSSKWMSDNNLGTKSVIGKSHYEVFPQIDENWKKIHQECLAGATKSNREDKFVREDGIVQWLSWEVKPWFDEGNVIGGIIMYTEDITAHKLVSEKLDISLKAFQQNFENAGIGMAIVSLEGKWLNVNDKICSILGYSKSEFNDLTFQDLTHPEDLASDLNFLQDVIDGKRQTYQVQKRYIHKLGHEVSAILAVSVVRDSKDNILYFISQLIDITALRSAQNQISALLQTTQDQNERLKNFAHIVSHNLRSHSSGMNMLLELLEFEHPNLFEMEILSLLKKGGINLSETIQHLTEIVNINLHETAENERVELYKILNKTIESVYPMAKQEGVELINEVTDELYVAGIPAYIESIVLNFVTNGIKYKSPDRESYLKVGVKEHKKTFEIRFEDNGLGIDLEKNGDLLFGMYKTFHKHQDARGIGLFITKNQIESIGGSVSVESKEGVGTTFSVFLLKDQKH
ncbi:PAS domain S-box protein [uncultured Cyclobacterium sp.]|uniref:PAS domain S-box protein n=1 Tax=uncultured Cyclobacterium sp. TaxID=453820 RepID=UPI0030EC7281|tara:strand:+ start:195333 stop:197942 length:2610 start_codon:yes stop_codon:yes gene_type:complete